MRRNPRCPVERRTARTFRCCSRRRRVSWLRNAWSATAPSRGSFAPTGPLQAPPSGKAKAARRTGVHEGVLFASVGPTVVVSRDVPDAKVGTSGAGDQTIAGNAGDLAQPLGGGGGTVTYSYSKNSPSGGNFQFTDPDYNTLMATLTARMGREEIGRCISEPDARAKWDKRPPGRVHRQCPG